MLADPKKIPQLQNYHFENRGKRQKQTIQEMFYVQCSQTNSLDLGPLHTRDWEPIITLEALSLVEKEEPVQVRFTLCLRDQRNSWLQDEYKVYMGSYMALNESCSMVTLIILKHHLLDVGSTQNHKTTTLWTFTTIDLFYIIIREDLHE